MVIYSSFTNETDWRSTGCHAQAVGTSWLKMSQTLDQLFFSFFFLYPCHVYFPKAVLLTSPSLTHEGAHWCLLTRWQSHLERSNLGQSDALHEISPLTLSSCAGFCPSRLFPSGVSDRETSQKQLSNDLHRHMKHETKKVRKEWIYKIIRNLLN